MQMFRQKKSNIFILTTTIKRGIRTNEKHYHNYIEKTRQMRYFTEILFSTRGHWILFAWRLGLNGVAISIKTCYV